MNEIQQKLQIFDKQFSSFNWLEITLQRRPLLLPALALSVGIFLSTHITEATIIAVLGCFCIILATLFFALKSKRKIVAIILIACSFSLLGTLRFFAREDYKSDHINSINIESKIPLRIRGVISSIPSRRDYSHWHFNFFTWGKSPYRFTVDLSEIETKNSWEKISGRVYVTLNSNQTTSLEIGDSIETAGWLDKFSKARNIGQFDFAEYMANNGILYRLKIANEDSVSTQNSSSLQRLKFAGRRFMQRLHSLAEPSYIKHSKLLNALISGHRGELESETMRSFRRSGLLHLLSLSGLHIALLLSIIWLIAKTIGITKSYRALMCIILCIGFVFLVEPRPPIIRAATISIIYFCAVLLKRKPDIINTLALSAIILLLYKPQNLFDVGFELSFVTILSIVLFQEHLRFAIDSISGFRFSNSSQTNGLRKIFSKFIDLFIVGIAASIGSAGIIAYHFHAVYPLCAIWSCAALPFFTITLASQLLRLCVLVIFPGLIGFINPIVNFFAEIMTRLVDLMATVNFSEILIGSPSKLGISILYAMIIAAYISLRTRRFRKLLKPAAIGIIASFAFVVFASNAALESDSLQVTIFALGNGHCVFVEQGKENLLINCGSRYGKDVGRNVIYPYMRRLGIRKIDNILITKISLEYINGLDGIFENFAPQNIYCSNYYFDADKSSKTVYSLSNLACAANVKILQTPKTLQIGKATISNISSEKLPSNLEISFKEKTIALPTCAEHKMEIIKIGSTGKISCKTF